MGDFNGWDPTANPFESIGDGVWRATVTLSAGHRYTFRYLGADGTWFNDEAADHYEPSGMGEDNSILDLTHLA